MNSGNDEVGRPDTHPGPTPGAPWQVEWLELCIETAGDPPPLMHEIGSEVMVVSKPGGDHVCGVGAHLLGDNEIWPSPINDLGEMSWVGFAVEQIRCHHLESLNHG